MGVADPYDLELIWPSSSPRGVIATGTFDQWSSSVHLTKGDTGFFGTVKVPWGEKVAYKYIIVDGHWKCRDDLPQEDDEYGNINNVLQTPGKPKATGAADFYDLKFIWPSLSHEDVIVTGTFDQWSSSIYLTKGDTGFCGTVNVPWGEKIAYKYIVVDGHWKCRDDLPQEDNGNGSVNNVFRAPKKPEAISVANLYDLEFIWPSLSQKGVIVTGTFDQWSSSIYLTKGNTGFCGTVKVPWGEKIAYKFITVDSLWRCRDDLPQEDDGYGNINNVLRTPTKPEAMSAADLYDLKFIWPSTGPKDVVVTGTFDRWSASIRLTKGDTGFFGTAKVPWGKKVAYKYIIVDGHWNCRDDLPQEDDGHGNINNVLRTPERPEVPAIHAPSLHIVLESTQGRGDGDVKTMAAAPADLTALTMPQLAVEDLNSTCTPICKAKLVLMSVQLSQLGSKTYGMTGVTEGAIL